MDLPMPVLSQHVDETYAAEPLACGTALAELALPDTGPGSGHRRVHAVLAYLNA